jgi:hypothetical protein
MTVSRCIGVGLANAVVLGGLLIGTAPASAGYMSTFAWNSSANGASYSTGGAAGTLSHSNDVVTNLGNVGFSYGPLNPGLGDAIIVYVADAADVGNQVVISVSSIRSVSYSNIVATPHQFAVQSRLSSSSAPNLASAFVGNTDMIGDIVSFVDNSKVGFPNGQAIVTVQGVGTGANQFNATSTLGVYSFYGIQRTPYVVPSTVSGPRSLEQDLDITLQPSAAGEVFTFAVPGGSADSTLGSVVPEPSSLSLAGVAVAIGVSYAWRRRRRAEAQM